jgi:hypothetical protein
VTSISIAKRAGHSLVCYLPQAVIVSRGGLAALGFPRGYRWHGLAHMTVMLLANSGAAVHTPIPALAFAAA